MAALILVLHFAISSFICAPFANPPAIHIDDKDEFNDAAVECGFVAFESFTQETPLILATSSIRCLPNEKF